MLRARVLPIAFAAFSGGATYAQCVIVDPNGGGNFTSLQAAIDAVNSGTAILVRGGTYTAIRIDKSDQRIEQLLTALESERNLTKTYKLEVARLYAELKDVRAAQAKGQPAKRSSPKQKSAMTSAGRD